MCAYYVMLGTARFSAVLCGHGSTPESPSGTDYFIMRLSGILLAMLSLVLSGVTYLSLAQNIAVKHHEIMMITIEAYTFFKLGIAVTRAIRQRKAPSSAGGHSEHRLCRGRLRFHVTALHARLFRPHER